MGDFNFNPFGIAYSLLVRVFKGKGKPYYIKCPKCGSKAWGGEGTVDGRYYCQTCEMYVESKRRK